MPLIEGVGDEVTFVLGSFIILVVTLLAWFSTHSDDIPLIREVIVELRVRQRSGHNLTTEQPQENEISQSSREGIASTTEQQETLPSQSTLDGNGTIEEEGVDDSRRTEDISLLQSLLTDSSPSSSESQISSESLTPSTSNVECGKKTTATMTAISSTATVPSLEETVGATASLSTIEENCSEDSESKSISTSLVSTDIEETVTTSETKEQLLRRRRVQYFESGALCQASDSLDSVSLDKRTVDMDNHSNVIVTASSTSSWDSRSNVFVSDKNSCDNSGDSSSSSDRDKQAAVMDSSSTQPMTSTSEESGVPINQTAQNPQQHGGDADIGDDDGSVGSRIRVRLKYMNETQRFVYANPADTIGEFRRAHFQSELQEDKWVRFIFNGQDLRDDARTLQACNIENNCTMHCLVTARQRAQNRPEATAEEDEDSMLGAFMYPLFTLLLLVVWYFRIFYRQYFSAMSTVCLIGISFLLTLSYISSIRTTSDRGNGNPSPAGQGRATATAGGDGGAQNHPHSD